MNSNSIFIFLQGVSLQLQGFWDSWTRFWNPVPTDTSVAVVTPNYVPAVMLLIVAILFVIGFRYIVNARRHPNAEEPVGIIQFVVMKQGIFEAFVSKYDAPLRPSIIRTLKQNKKFEKAVDVLLDLREQGNLYFYQMYYRHVKDLLTSTIRRRSIPPIIVSTAPLDDPRFVFSQSEPKFSWASLGFDYMKTCVCHSSTELITVDTVNNEEMDVWLIAPVPMIQERSKYERNKEMERREELFEIWGKDLQIKEKPIEIIILPYKDELARAVSAMVMASKQVDYIEKLEEHMKSQEHELQERDKLINRFRQKLNMFKLLLGQKKLIGTDLPAGLGKPKDFIAWIVLGSLGGLVAGELPRYIPQLQGVDRFFMGGIGTMIIVAIYMMTRRSKKEEQREMLEEEGIDIENIQ